MPPSDSLGGIPPLDKQNKTMLEHLTKIEQIEFEAEYREWNDSLECQPPDYAPLGPDELEELQNAVQELLSR